MITSSTVMLALFKSFGVDPKEVMQSVDAVIALAKSIDSRIALLTAQNELILAKITRLEIAHGSQRDSDDGRPFDDRTDPDYDPHN